MFSSVKCVIVLTSANSFTEGCIKKTTGEISYGSLADFIVFKIGSHFSAVQV